MTKPFNLSQHLTRSWLNALDYEVKGDGIADDTAALQAAINAARDRKMRLVIPGGTYLVGTLLFDGTDYAVDTVAGSLFKQKPGLTGDSNYHPIWNITGSRIQFGDANFLGNIATDTAEFSPAVFFGSCKDVSTGVLHGKDLRGDVVYIYGRSSSEAEMTRGVQIAGITGDNVLRCILAISGGEGSVGYIRRVGSMKVGYKDVDFEPNSGGAYQPIDFRVGHVWGATVQCVSADPAVQNTAVRFGSMNLAGSRIANSTPAYSGHPGAGDFGISVQDVKLFDCGAVILRDYQVSPIKLGSKLGTFAFERIDFANCSTADATYNTIFLHLGAERPGLVRGGEVKGTLFSNTKMVFRSDTQFLNVAVDRVDVAGGTLGSRMTGRIGSLKLDAGASGNVVFNEFAGFSLGSGVITNAAPSIGFAGCANVELSDTTATFGTFDYAGGPSTNLIFKNCAINGALVPGINLLNGANFYRNGVVVP